MELKLSAETIELLDKLARESGKTPTEVVERLINTLDETRHVVWSSTKRQFVRVKCSHKGCFEATDIKSVGETRD